jgi:hypothetical protein
VLRIELFPCNVLLDYFMRYTSVFKSWPLIIFCYAAVAGAGEMDNVQVKSVHLGLVHPAGVDVLGYSVEKELGNGLYSFYTFGFPALAAMGFSYYEQYGGNGFTATAGVGIGFILYGSAAYQWQIGQRHYLKFGAGLGTGVSYNGAYPVLSYEYRFAQ